MRRVLPCLAFASVLSLALPLPSFAQEAPSPATTPAATTPAPAPEPAYMSDPRFLKAMADIHKPDRHSPYEIIDKWKKANKAAGGQCIECLRKLDELYIKYGQWKDAAATAAQYAAVAVTPTDKFMAAADGGEAALHAHQGKSKPEELAQADEFFQQALAISPHARTVLFEDGRALALLGKDDEARKRFAVFVSVARPDDPYRLRATHFVENPHLAALPMAPAFTIHTLQGEDFNLDNMHGKVVLLDFWASWCGPCRQTLPDVKRVVQKFAGQPLVVVSISIDRDEKAWQDAMQREGMSGWPQYRDADGKLSEAYSAQSIPRFFTIDTDGVLQSVQIGSDANIEGSLRKLVARAVEAQRQQALASDKPAIGQ